MSPLPGAAGAAHGAGGQDARPPAPERISASGRIHFWQGGSVWIGTGQGRTQWHGHHALQIALALEGVCRFRTREDGPWTEFRGALVRPDRPHQFEMAGATVAHLFVEPEMPQGRGLLQRFAGLDIVPLPEAERQALARPLLDAYRERAAAAALVALARQALDTLSGAAPRTAGGADPRIARALAHIHGGLRERLTLEAVAASVHLSPERFRHLFVAATGTTFRAYVLWSRLNACIAAATEGLSWTEAAHLAGFADSAHLNRTFKRMFGIAPTAIVRD